MLLNNQGQEVIVSDKLNAQERIQALQNLREVLVPQTHKGNNLFSIEERAKLK